MNALLLTQYSVAQASLINVMNKHQKKWVAQFFSRHPDYKISQPGGIIRLAAGGISITFERTEWIYLEPISAQYSGEYLPGFKWHYMTARLGLAEKVTEKEKDD
ncbi:hypothetical protein [Floridanema aerugineum]|uniref:Uncharacterized protein n=1 Tax=Floridaenema aerugineum BLCC-F46 TaxID=3153654 RepID=A0ABV4X330_9CYAN